MDETPLPASGRQRGGTVEPVLGRDVRPPDEPTPRAAATRVAGPTVRFEFHDPFMEVTYRYKTLREIVAKAEEFGSTRFQAFDAADKVTQVNKADGQWRRADGRPLEEPTVERPKAASQATRAASGRSRQATAAAPTPTLSQAPMPEPRPSTAEPRVSNETADHELYVARLKAQLAERYVQMRSPLGAVASGLAQTEYRYRGDVGRIAFTEAGQRLATDSNNPSVARSMVDVAETHGWKALRVSGHEDFRRQVWLEATLRGVKTIGYDVQPGDPELLAKERASRAVNRIEPGSNPASAGTARAKADGPEGAKSSARGGGGRKAVLAALEAVLIDRNVPTRTREAVMTAAAEQLAQRLSQGQTSRVKVYDVSAPSRRAEPVPNRSGGEQRTHEQAPGR